MAEGPEDAAEKVLNRLLSTRKAQRTRDAYLHAVRPYLRWCQAHKLEAITEDESTPLRYVAKLEQETTSRHSIATRVSALRQYYVQAVADGYLASSPMADLRPPSVQHLRTRTPSVLERGEAVQLLLAAEERPLDTAVMGFILLCGLTATQMAQIAIGHIQNQQGRLYVHIYEKREVAKQLRLPDYVARGVESLRAGRRSGPLLLSQAGTRLTSESVRRIVTRLCKKAGIRPTTTRELRYTMGALALDAGISAPTVAALLGSKDMRSAARLRAMTPPEDAPARLEGWLLGRGDRSLIAELHRLRDSGFPSAFVVAMCGAVIEARLAAIAEGLVDDPPEDPNIEWYKGVLRAAGVLSSQQNKELTARFHLRHEAAHGRGFDSLSERQASEMLVWSEELIATLERATPQPVRRRRLR